MKKIISVLLCLVLIFGLAVPSFAAETETADYNGYPVVIVRGIDFTGLYYEDGTKAMQISLGDILTFIKNYANDRFISKNEDALNKNALELVEKMFAPIANDRDGNSVNTLYYNKFDGSMAENAERVDGMEDVGEEGFVKTAVKKVGYENVYYFTYDWRKNARELAAELNSFINIALAETDKDMVNIAAASMGGAVTTAYMYYHGNEKINNLTYISSAHNGAYSCGDPLNGNIYFDANVLYERARDSVGSSIVTDMFMRICKAIGIFDVAAELVNRFVENNKELVYNEVLRDGFGTFMGFWALCPDDIFDSGVEKLFGGHEADYPVLMEKIADTREFIFSTEETIDSAIEDGVNITFTSGYGSALSPVYEKANQQGDKVLETYLTSNFATTSKIGETLSEEQIASADPRYLSPDKTVDATTALYKDITWFIKDCDHVPTETDSEFSEFALWLLLSDEKLTVNSSERYPQFMIVDSEGKLKADK